jgi:hypothetical protein
VVEGEREGDRAAPGVGHHVDRAGGADGVEDIDEVGGEGGWGL